jgi:Ser/Thr protein kinase RdoA (MazF antagonist)
MENDRSAGEQLATLIERRYAASAVQLQLLAQSSKEVYRVHRLDGPDWIVRVYVTGDDLASLPPVAHLVAVLRFLEERAYLAERLVRARDGSDVVHHAGVHVVMTTYLGDTLQPWQPGRSSGVPTRRQTHAVRQVAVHFSALGAALGRLHTLRLNGNTPLPPAGMLPSRELAWVAGLLADVANQVPPGLQAQHAQLVTAVEEMDRCEDLPITLIHNDCNLGNAVLTPSGEVALVDWDAAGLGPAVLDVGIALRNCYSKPEARIDRTAVTALVDGYCRHRLLTQDELQRLLDAVQFMTLVLLAAYFPACVARTLADDAPVYGAPYPAWQAQYAAAGEIAAVARARFEQHLDRMH